MAKSFFQQIINLVSLACALSSFWLIIVYWQEFTQTKILLLFLIMTLFLYILFMNQKKMSKGRLQGYGKIRSNFETKPKNQMLGKLSDFFNQLGQSPERNSASTIRRPQWNTGLSYSSEVQQISQTNKLFFSENRSQIDKRGDLGTKSQQIRAFIPQNLTQIFSQIRQIINPARYFRIFRQQVQILRGTNDSLKYESSKRLFDDKYKSSLESLCIDKDKNILLAENYDVIIKDEIYCAEIICQHFDKRVEEMLKQMSNNFKIVSQIVMKCFGMNVSLNIGKMANDYDANDLSIEELIDFLRKLTNNSYMPSKFKPLIPIKDFIKLHLPRLYRHTEQLSAFFGSIQNEQLMAFRIYIRILKQIFRRENIQISSNLSSYSEQMKRISYGFYVHQVKGDVYFTFNRMKGFVTRNPLIVAIAFLTENFKQSENWEKEIVHDVNRFFIKQTKST